MHQWGEFSDPISMKHPVIESDGPWVGTLSSGKLVSTRPKKDEPDVVITAFVNCPVSEEDQLLRRVFEDLWTISEKAGWDNRAASIEEGVAKMRSFGLQPKCLTLPFASLRDVTSDDLTQEEADQLSLSKGCITEVDGVKVLSGREALPDRTAIITTVPALTGSYVRVLDQLTLLFCRANTLMLVR